MRTLIFHSTFGVHAGVSPLSCHLINTFESTLLNRVAILTGPGPSFPFLARTLLGELDPKPSVSFFSMIPWFSRPIPSHFDLSSPGVRLARWLTF